jgi:hypothetical protein
MLRLCSNEEVLLCLVVLLPQQKINETTDVPNDEELWLRD